jgi:hypothetical protein
MAIDAAAVKMLVERELAPLADARALVLIRRLLVEPYAVLRGWDYGGPDAAYPCWTVLEHRDSNSGIAYCESGFGPRAPWGLVGLSEKPINMRIGPDSSWFSSLLDAFFESFAAADLPIWRVVRMESSGQRRLLTPEDSWGEAWARVAEYRKADPEGCYYPDHTIDYLGR